MSEKELKGVGKSEPFDRQISTIKAEDINSLKIKVIYSGVQGSKDRFANSVECFQNSATALIRFFNQRPVRLADIEAQVNGNNLQAALGQMDAIEYALQTSVVLPMDTARNLRDMLNDIIQVYDELEK